MGSRISAKPSAKTTDVPAHKYQQRRSCFLAIVELDADLVLADDVETAKCLAEVHAVLDAAQQDFPQCLPVRAEVARWDWGVSACVRNAPASGWPPLNPLQIAIQEPDTPCAAAAALAEQLMEICRQASRQRRLSLGVDPDSISLIAACGRRVPLVDVEGNARAPESLREAEDALTTATALRTRWHLETQALATAQRLSAQARHRADAGLASRLDTLEQRQSALRRELSLLDLRAQVLEARVAVHKTLAWP